MNKNLSLYIHLPWCIKKCPYCDFNSHAVIGDIPEEAYIDCLLEDFNSHLTSIEGRQISSVFFGGGTPSLFSAESLNRLLKTLQSSIAFSSDCEITLEANPGTVEQTRFRKYFEIGINRISLGIQSFQADKLKALGRIHNDIEAHTAIDSVKKAGFINFNIDLMHGLPNQTSEESLNDIAQAINHKPTHLSWYQLTIEPNTYFYKHTPTLPNENTLESIEMEGLGLLEKNNYQRYEISAYSLPGKQSQHNKNYWLFGDYLGIGAGAHSKLTVNSKITRHWNHKSPHSYMKKNELFISNKIEIKEPDIIFEFMLNALRLFEPVSFELFEQKTGLNRNVLKIPFELAVKKGLLKNKSFIETTDLGKKFLNDLCRIFIQ
ncbi:MAG: radical SAM family heme chaperone HemW [Gammaproteobacteria bacterium]|nr:radical SAM family heme chaperone HemW [Gammaproteobacteria bacterium]